MRLQTVRGAFASFMAAAPLAFAQVPSSEPVRAALSLRWNDPASLAATSEAEFESHLSERLGYPAFTAAPARDTLVVTWLGSPEQCQVELQLARGPDVQGTRSLESPTGDCRSLVPALLTVAALLLESRPAEPAQAAPPVAPPHEEPVVPPQPPAPAPRRDPQFLLSFGPELGSGLTPKAELGAAAALVFAPAPPLRVGLSGAFFFPHQYGSAPGLSLQHDRIGLLGCGMHQVHSLGLGVCANAARHRFQADGISLAHPQATQNAVWTLGLGLRAEWRLTGHLWWVGHLDGDVVTRPLYFYFTPAPGGASILFSQPRIVPSLFLGLTLELP